MSENEYDTLDKERKESILFTAKMLKDKAKQILEQLKEVEVKDLEKIKQIMEEYYKNEMYDLKEEYKNMFTDDEIVQNYFDISMQ